MRRVLVVVACFALMAGTAAAQAQAPRPPDSPDTAIFIAEQGAPQAHTTAPPPPPPRPGDLGKWWKNSDVVRELQLTDAQATQLETAFFDHRMKLIDLKANVEREEARLQPLIEADQLDLPKVSAQLDAVLGARAQLEKQQTMMMLSMRKVLTVEQWKKLQKIQMERERHWDGYAPGAPGGPRMRTPGPDREAGPPRPPEP